jgi:hypothetical protein
VTEQGEVELNATMVRDSFPETDLVPPK